MERSGFDTRAWNLSLPITALSVVGCGPQVILEDGTGHTTEGETEGDTDTTPGSVSDTDPTSPVTTSPPPECTTPDDCGPGYTCQNNVCVPDDDYCYGDYGGYYGGDCCYEDCCYGDCYYSECYEHQECGPAAICDTSYGYGNCQSVPYMEECPQAPELVEIPVAMWGTSLVSLSFVEVDGDGMQDLLVGRGGSTELVRGPLDGEPVALPVTAQMAHAVSGDFNGDMVPDIATISTDGMLSIAVGDGMGGFVSASQTPGIPATSGLSALEWSGDGNLDLAGFTEGEASVVILGDGMGGIAGLEALEDAGPAVSMASAELDGDARGDLVLQTWYSADVYLGGTGDTFADYTLDWTSFEDRRRIAAADFDGSGLSELVGRAALVDWLLVDTWRDGVGPDRLAVPFSSSSAALAGMADVDGDGIIDVVIVDGLDLVLLHGAPPGGPILACYSRHPLGFGPSALTVGDADGNGRAEIAMRDDGTLRILSAL